MKALLITYVLILLQIQILGQNMKTFYIDCDQEEFNDMYENYDQKIVINVDLTHDSVSWSNISLHIRGDGSREYPKKSLKVLFDSIPFISGDHELNFNAEYNDVSYMRSFLSSYFFRNAGIICPSMEHVILYLNGSFFGIYLMVEEVNEFFMKNRLPDNGNLYKAASDGACLSIYDNVYYHWEKIVNDTPGRKDLEQLIQDLNNCENQNFPEFLNNHFEYGYFVTWISVNMLIANGSTYYHNYFLFNNTFNQGKWITIPWDLDLTMDAYSKWYPFHRSSGFWTPDNPLLEKSLINDMVFNDIRVKVSQLSSDLFNPNTLFPVIDSLYTVLLPYISLDTTDQIEDLETWDQFIESNRDFIHTRIDHLTYQFLNSPRNFKLHRTSGYFYPGEPILLSWDASSDPNNLNLSYTLYFGNNRILTDSTAQVISGLTETSYLINGLEEEGKYYWKVEVTNNGQILEGFDTYNPFFVSRGIPLIVINEINYKSTPEFNTGDWVEFYNPNDTAVNISNWYFMDEDNTHKFSFPAEAILEPNGYIVLCRDSSAFSQFYPDILNVTGNMNFGLSSSGELVRLYNPIGYLVDSLVYKSEHPWPTSPNGNGPTLELLNPLLDNALPYSWSGSNGNGTPGMQNSMFSPESIGELDRAAQAGIFIYPNPVNPSTIIRFEILESCDVVISISNSMGSKVVEKKLGNHLPGIHFFYWDTKDLLPGFYYICVKAGSEIHAIGKAIKRIDRSR